jgi:hypothetical protein
MVFHMDKHIYWVLMHAGDKPHASMRGATGWVVVPSRGPIPLKFLLDYIERYDSATVT